MRVLFLKRAHGGPREDAFGSEQFHSVAIGPKRNFSWGECSSLASYGFDHLKAAMPSVYCPNISGLYLYFLSRPETSNEQTFTPALSVWITQLIAQARMFLASLSKGFSSRDLAALTNM